MTDYNKIFPDTAPIIYFLEKSDLYYEKMRQILQSFIDKDTELFTSAITYEEYEVGPLKSGNTQLIQNFERFIDDLGINVINIDQSIAAKAAYIRAKYSGFKAMDSLQLASAVSENCDLLLTAKALLSEFAPWIFLLPACVYMGSLIFLISNEYQPLHP